VTEPSTSHVEQEVQRKIAAARAKVQAARQRRAELSAARRRGLAARHANRLRRQAEQRWNAENDHGQDDGDTEEGTP
jgi:post-segregation antitoxin (ccd killing protein)